MSTSRSLFQASLILSLTLSLMACNSSQGTSGENADVNLAALGILGSMNGNSPGVGIGMMGGGNSTLMIPVGTFNSGGNIGLGGLGFPGMDYVGTPGSGELPNTSPCTNSSLDPNFCATGDLSTANSSWRWNYSSTLSGSKSLNGTGDSAAQGGKGALGCIGGGSGTRRDIVISGSWKPDGTTITHNLVVFISDFRGPATYTFGPSQSEEYAISFFSPSEVLLSNSFSGNCTVSLTRADTLSGSSLGQCTGTFSCTGLASSSQNSGVKSLTGGFSGPSFIAP